MKKTMRKYPRDVNQRAKSVVDLATRDVEPHAAAVALGRLGGLKGGTARAVALSPKKRTRIARAAAKARWGE
jgi:hypothetical protein